MSKSKLGPITVDQEEAEQWILDASSKRLRESLRLLKTKYREHEFDWAREAIKNELAKRE